MIESNRKKLWRKIWVIKGSQKQVLKAAEESGELNVALLQYSNKYDESNSIIKKQLEANVIEEIADVKNMIEQLEDNLNFLNPEIIIDQQNFKANKVKNKYF